MYFAPSFLRSAAADVVRIYSSKSRRLAFGCNSGEGAIPPGGGTISRPRYSVLYREGPSSSTGPMQ